MYLLRYLTIIKKTSVPMTSVGFILNPNQMLKQEIKFYKAQFSTIIESKIGISPEMLNIFQSFEL